MRSGQRLGNQLAVSPAKLPLFHVFCIAALIRFSKKHVIDNKATLPILDICHYI